MAAIKDEFKRLYFITSHELEVGESKLVHTAGKYYNVGVAHVEKLIAAGIARLAEDQEKLEKDAAERLAEANAPVQTPAEEQTPAAVESDPGDEHQQ